MALTPTKLWTGRRKESVARVRLTPGDGVFTINGRTIDEYFPTRVHRMVAASAAVLPSLRISWLTLNSIGKPWQSQPGT